MRFLYKFGVFEVWTTVIKNKSKIFKSNNINYIFFYFYHLNKKYLSDCIFFTDILQ
jgi:hypothetical protein